MSGLASFEQTWLHELRRCTDEAGLCSWNTKFFGKQGEITQAIKRVASVPANDRRAYGQEANRIKESLTGAYESALAQVKEKSLAQSLAAEALDVTLPGRPVMPGRLHVATAVLRTIYSIFADM